MSFRWSRFIMGAAVLCGLGVAYGALELAPPSHSTRSVLVEIPQGSGVSAIARSLARKHLVRSASVFTLWMRLRGLDHAIQAGAYSLSPNLGAGGIAARLISGAGRLDRIVVPEGYSIRQIAARLDEMREGAGNRFLALAQDATPYKAEFPWLRALPAGASLEGFLFPDTYVVMPEAGNEQALIRLMLERFSQVALGAYHSSGAPPLNLFETITLASIVEKEAVKPAERPLIAGVFFNRLACRMPFGSDPTVEYALHRHEGVSGLSLKDVAVESPYNTYRHAGLPPGPIANPGLSSIQAALEPDKTPFLYFVARGDGTHAFSRTYKEHLLAQRLILDAARSSKERP